MESQPQNPECRIIPENFHPCVLLDPKSHTLPMSHWAPLHMLHQIKAPPFYTDLDLQRQC